MKQLMGLPDIVYYTIAHWYDNDRQTYDKHRQRYDNAAHRYDRSLLQPVTGQPPKKAKSSLKT